MEITRTEKIRLGVFTFGTLAILAGIVFYMVGRNLLKKEDPYFVRYSESVDGLLNGAQVKLNGVVVGRVTSMRVDPKDVNRIIVNFAVTHGTPIRKDMVANLAGGLSITGLKNIEISGGSNESPPIPLGGEVRSGVSQIKMLTGQAETIALKFETLLNNLLGFTDANNQKNLQQLLKSLGELSVEIDGFLSENRGSLAKIPQELGENLKLTRATLTKLDGFVEDLKKAKVGEKIGEAVTAYGEVGKELSLKVKKTDLDGTLKDMRKSAVKIGDAAAKLDNTLQIIREDLTKSMRYFRETTENLADFSRIIRENPSLLLRSEDKQERRK